MINNFKLDFIYTKYFLGFFLGIGLKELYLPIAAIVLLVLAFKPNVKVTKYYLVITYLMLASMVPCYLFWEGLIELERPVISMLAPLFYVFASGVVILTMNDEQRNTFVRYFVYGIGTHAVIVAAYSFNQDPLLYGYSRLVDPFSGNEINSPGVSTRIAIFSALIMYILFVKKGTFLRDAVLLAVLIINFMLSMFLGGRMFIIIIGLSIFLIFIKRGVFSTRNSALVIMTSFLIIYLAASTNVSEYYKILSMRMSTLLEEGGRWSLYSEGLLLTATNPLGGFSPSTHIWFHNIFLDNARLGGWFALLHLLLLIILPLLYAIKYMGRVNELALFIFIIAFAVVNQDVVLEGEYRNFVLIYISSLLIMQKNCGDTQTLRVKNIIDNNFTRNLTV